MIVGIDPDHGGDSNVGGSSANNATGPSETKEKNLTLDVAKLDLDGLMLAELDRHPTVAPVGLMICCFPVIKRLGADTQSA